jgi:hypothetical protein
VQFDSFVLGAEGEFGYNGWRPDVFAGSLAGSFAASFPLLDPPIGSSISR